MTASKKANLQFIIALGATIGAAQVVFRGVSLTYGMMIGMVACVLVSVVVAGGVSWLAGRLIKSKDG